MKVRNVAIIGLFLGLILGNRFAQQLEVLALILGIVSVIMILKGGKQIIKGSWGGLLFGLTSGYFLYTIIVNPTVVLSLFPK